MTVNLKWWTKWVKMPGGSLEVNLMDGNSTHDEETEEKPPESRSFRLD